MIELDSDFPFVWRLSAESNEGLCEVSMLVPGVEVNGQNHFMIETSVLSLSSDSSRSESEEILEWNQDDIDLFMRMVNARRQQQNLPAADNLRVDLSDPAIVEIVNVVAAAGFGTAYLSSGVLMDTETSVPRHACEIGGFAALHTVDGFKACVVIATDQDDVVCVLLEDIELDEEGEYEELFRHDLLMVTRADLLHPGFASLDWDEKVRTLH